MSEGEFNNLSANQVSKNGDVKRDVQIRYECDACDKQAEIDKLDKHGITLLPRGWTQNVKLRGLPALTLCEECSVTLGGCTD